MPISNCTYDLIHSVDTSDYWVLALSTFHTEFYLVVLKALGSYDYTTG